MEARYICIRSPFKTYVSALLATVGSIDFKTDGALGKVTPTQRSQIDTHQIGGIWGLKMNAFCEEGRLEIGYNPGVALVIHVPMWFPLQGDAIQNVKNILAQK